MNDTPLPPQADSQQPGPAQPVPTDSGTKPQPDQITRFFDWIRSSGLNRDGDRWFAGVCGGIAARTGLDPLIVRGIAVVLTILGAPVVFAYAVGWALLPRGAGRIYAEDVLRGRFQPAMIAIGALLLFTIVPIFQDGWWRGPGFGLPSSLSTLFGIGWSLALLAGIVWLVVYLVRRRRGTGTQPGGPDGSTRSTGSPSGRSGSYPIPGYGSTPSNPTPSPASDYETAALVPEASAASATQSPSTTSAPYSATPYAAKPEQQPNQNNIWQEQRLARQAARRALVRARRPGAGFSAIVLGLALATGAVAAGVNSNGVWSQDAVILGVAFALGVLALGIVIAGIRGRTDGAMGGFAFLAAATLIVLGVFPQGTQFSLVGNTVWSPSANSAAADPTSSYAMIVGNTTLDLSDFDNPGLNEDSVIDVWLLVGATDIQLPADAPVRVESSALVGGVEYSGRTVAAENGEQTGVFTFDQRTFNANSRSDGPLVRIFTLAGVVTLDSSND
ncbi:PspC domain-containing protein [Cryobacterium sp. PH31-O1]|uniref:PspC domain-containing protein n=1 Tax=Cryobacterium sp. PH31-O1 TaxID=3046306 RepID=UPI0024B9D46A|nr:PspC domain-containing protein [Cryobacterium sp. PH31-O1]MDJ0338592.1 PspC domain-containing protein [Cryobacterium sp. PH31-O1]